VSSRLRQTGNGVLDRLDVDHVVGRSAGDVEPVAGLDEGTGQQPGGHQKPPFSDALEFLVCGVSLEGTSRQRSSAPTSTGATTITRMRR
jgi:hypothetical protein